MDPKQMRPRTERACRRARYFFPEIGGPEDIAAALAATAAGVADGVISADEAALVANVLQKSWMCSKRRIAFVAACRWWMTAAGDRP
jgi:hypothetical protein